MPLNKETETKPKYVLYLRTNVSLPFVLFTIQNSYVKGSI